MRTITLIIVHCSANKAGSAFRLADIDRYHRSLGWKGCGYHYVIPADGTIEKGRCRRKADGHPDGRTTDCFKATAVIPAPEISQSLNRRASGFRPAKGMSVFRRRIGVWLEFIVCFVLLVQPNGAEVSAPYCQMIGGVYLLADFDASANQFFRSLFRDGCLYCHDVQEAFADWKALYSLYS